MHPLIQTLFDCNIITVNGKFLTTRPDVFFKKNANIFQSLIESTNFLASTASVQERVFCLMNGITEIQTCKHCGEPVKYKRNLFMYDTFCGVSCATSNITTKEKRKYTNTLKYGTCNVSNVDVIKNKKRKTLLKNFGVSGLNDSLIINEKRKQTNIEKYGHYNPFGSSTIKNKIKKQNKERYGVDYTGSFYIGDSTLTKLNDVEWLIQQHHVNALTLKDIALELSVDPTTVANYFRKHGVEIKHFFVSSGEKQIEQFLKGMGNFTINTNVRTIIPPYELDIVVPEKNLAIEYCGLYWHSDRFKDRNYHRMKTDMCQQKGYRLLTIFEDDWLHKRDIVERILRERLGVNNQQKIYARRCESRQILDKIERDNFFDNEHIQGSAKSSLTYGLYYNSTLVACMSFIRRGEGIFELNRYATKLKVVGGFGKLLSFFKENNPSWIKIITFADKTWSSGDLYKTMKFKEITPHVPVSYYYVQGVKRVHRSNYMRRHLPKKISNFNPSLTEFENCDRNGILRVWDCGLIKFVQESVDF